MFLFVGGCFVLFCCIGFVSLLLVVVVFCLFFVWGFLWCFFLWGGSVLFCFCSGVVGVLGLLFFLYLLFLCLFCFGFVFVFSVFWQIFTKRSNTLSCVCILPV